MQHVIMTVGLQASGKSTWAKEQVRKSGGTFKRINKDDLRAMIDPDWSREKEKFVLRARDAMLVAALKAGHNVIIDDTNFDSRHWKDVMFQLKKLDIDVTLREEVFEVDLEEAIRRDANRPSPVGEDVIRRTWKQHIKGSGPIKPRMEVIYANRHFRAIQDENLPKSIICDLDGTLAIIGDRSPYDASRCDELDKPNFPVVETVRLFFNAGYQVIFVSGRDEKDRRPSERFIIQHLPELSATFIHNEMNRLLGDYKELATDDPRRQEIDVEAQLLGEQLVKIPVDAKHALLLMRSRGDMRPDTVVKREIWDTQLIHRFNVKLVLDDRATVVETWRNDIGLTCFQVAEGNF